MNTLYKLLLVGASLGIANQLAAAFPEPKPEKVISERDKANIAKAELKRQRRIERNKEKSHD